MKDYIRLIPSPVYAESNRQTLSVLETILGDEVEKDFFQNHLYPVLITHLKEHYLEKYPKANFISVARYFSH
jgi:hypothetical protein